MLTLPADEVTVTGGLATSTAPTAVFDGLAVEQTTADVMGLSWLCPVDAGGAAAPPGEPPLGIGDGPPQPAMPSWPWTVEASPDGRLLVRP